MVKPSWSKSVIFEVRFSIFEGPFRLISVRFEPNRTVSYVPVNCNTDDKLKIWLQYSKWLYA